MPTILTQIREATDGWPRRVGGCLFAASGGKVDWLESPSALTGWLGSVTGHPPIFGAGAGLHCPAEVHAELRRTAEGYDAIEVMPHEPPLPRHYYACEMPAPGDGKRFNQLLAMFSPSTEADAEIIRAMYATALWGGPPGARPLFLITAPDGRGCGKSRLVAMLAHLVGGLIDIGYHEDAGVMKQRLLSPEGLTKRIVLMDNLKSPKCSWPELESLITSPVVSGKRLYHGEASRPNTLVWVMTANGASLSKDVASRVATISLRKPLFSATWEEDCRKFIDDHRDAIIADIVAFLQSPRQHLASHSRWGAWESDIVSRLENPTEVQRIIAERQQVADVEHEETAIIEEFFAERLAEMTYTDEDVVFVPSKMAATWLTEATREPKSVVTASRILTQAINEGGFSCLTVSKSRAKQGRGFIWRGSDSTPSTPVLYDIEEREYMRVKRQEWR